MKNKFLKIFGLITVLTIFNQTLTLFRASIMAHQFGTSNQMDAFNFANTLMVCVTNIFGSAIVTVFVPFLTRVKNRDDRKVLNSYINMMGIIVLMLLGAYSIGSFVYLRMMAANPNTFWAIMISLSFILGIGQYIRFFSNFQTSMLQVTGKFSMIKIAAISSTVFSLAGLIYFHNRLSITLAAIIITISYLIEYVVLRISNQEKKYRHQWVLDIKNDRTKELFRLTVPIVLNSTIYQISLMIPNVIARSFGVGVVSMSVYANQILNIMQTLIILNLLSVLYPELVTVFQNKTIEAAKIKLGYYINLTNLIVIPMMFGAIVLGQSLIAILFQRGNFTPTDTNNVWKFLIFGSLSLPLIVYKEFYYRVFYSQSDTKTPVKISITSIVIQMIFLIGGIHVIGIWALMASPLVATIVAAIYARERLIKKIGKLVDDGRQLFFSLVNSSIMAFVITLIQPNLHGNRIIKLLVLIAIGIVVYGVLVWICQRKYFLSEIGGQND
ncbi:lipid II flippase MurJ [Lactobacillus sp. YT155]|uniref:murein biosynthesis integral membrane protein MurJ n=1 Tax=Lactobacillus sp. YT155 TaxID=3060955 RepID=UPI00265FA37E|nr:lipid II flippase MurJ [Lactobacillus sp. YT155]MDO1604838.1 lipid II flippase MurJ [Lactobacillus sp. YT155]